MTKDRGLKSLPFFQKENGFRPADRLGGRELVIADDLEILFRDSPNVFERMDLKVVKEFENRSDERGFDGDKDELAAGLQDSRQFLQTGVERNIFEHAARKNEIERTVGKRELENVSLDRFDILRVDSFLFFELFTRDLQRIERQV